MRFPPQDLATERLEGELASGWAIHLASIDYFPEGGGSHHWRATEDGGAGHFVTVDDLDDKDWLGEDRDSIFECLRSAFETASLLRDPIGLGFVVAPVAGVDGTVVRRIDNRYAISVFPLYVGHSYPFGPYGDASLRDGAIDMVTELHLSTPAVRDRAPLHILRYGGRHDLEAFLAEPERPWDGGPLSEVTRVVFLDHLADLAELATGFEHLADRTAAARRRTVITHGEPHPANLLSVDDHLMLVDWDTAALAPPERDLALFGTERDASIDRYQHATGHEVNFEVVTLYQLRWYLDDLASTVRLFRRVHEKNPDTELWSEGLTARIAQLPSWLARLG
jgi:spectinomycin phosphotransferase